MFKRIVILFTVICLAVGLSGCKFSIRNTVEDQATTLPPLRIDSNLVCQITDIEGNRCTVTILEGNSTYDAEDEIYVTYQSVSQNQRLRRGDVISLTYNYVTDVSAIGNTPHIAAQSVTVIQDYTPPETTEGTTE